MSFTRGGSRSYYIASDPSLKLADVIAGNGQWRELDLIIAHRSGCSCPFVFPRPSSLATAEAFVSCFCTCGSAASRVHDNCHTVTSVRFAGALLRVRIVFFSLSLFFPLLHPVAYAREHAEK